MQPSKHQGKEHILGWKYYNLNTLMNLRYVENEFTLSNHKLVLIYDNIKLDNFQKYYLGVESLWNMASPGAYVRPAVNTAPLSTPELVSTPKMTGLLVK